jgi:hypothetical protein
MSHSTSNLQMWAPENQTFPWHLRDSLSESLFAAEVPLSMAHHSFSSLTNDMEDRVQQQLAGTASNLHQQGQQNTISNNPAITMSANYDLLQQIRSSVIPISATDQRLANIWQLPPSPQQQHLAGPGCGTTAKQQAVVSPDMFSFTHPEQPLFHDSRNLSNSAVSPPPPPLMTCDSTGALSFNLLEPTGIPAVPHQQPTEPKTIPPKLAMEVQQLNTMLDEQIRQIQQQMSKLREEQKNQPTPINPRPRVKEVAKPEATKRQGKSKDEDRPKRPLTAYNLFFKSERAKMLTELAMANEAAVAKGSNQRSSKMGFEEMAKRISIKWNEADAKTKADFQVIADRDRQRYAIEKAAYLHRKRERSTASEEGRR